MEVYCLQFVVSLFVASYAFMTHTYWQYHSVGVDEYGRGYSVTKERAGQAAAGDALARLRSSNRLVSPLADLESAPKHSSDGLEKERPSQSSRTNHHTR
jgi:hypothetical protein